MAGEADRLRRRLEREHDARIQAESIAERVTGQLYDTVLELRKMNDEIAAMNQAMRDFVAIASHDLRSPLTAIVGFADLLGDAWDQLTEEKRREMITVIARQGRHLDALIDDLLTISSIDAGALDTHRVVVDVADVVDHAIGELAERGISVRLTISQPHPVFANPDHVRRIVANYLQNAVKYGAEPLEVVVVERDGYVEIAVCDHGDGVPAEFLERLFTRFARAETAATREQKGTGLGLSIVRGLAQANDGDAWYEPNVPAGSRFCVRLPTPT